MEGLECKESIEVWQRCLYELGEAFRKYLRLAPPIPLRCTVPVIEFPHVFRLLVYIRNKRRKGKRPIKIQASTSSG